MYVGIYLAAIVAANLVITRLGPEASILTAFALIGCDLTVRDHLHSRWEDRSLVPRMALLIGTGSVLSWLLNRDAGPIALASFIAFAASGAADAVVFAWLRPVARLWRINGSNVGSSLVDSILFPTLAFGGLLPVVVLGQFAAKVGGGFVWSLILRSRE